MTIGLAEKYVLSRMGSFRERVEVAVAKAALDVASEIPDATPRSQHRRALSARVMENREGTDYTTRFAIAAVNAWNMVLDPSDELIQNAINSAWDAVAGAEPPTPSP